MFAGFLPEIQSAVSAKNTPQKPLFGDGCHNHKHSGWILGIKMIKPPKNRLSRFSWVNFSPGGFTPTLIKS
jgi:hypothetical protein